jgi:hypothetical protein
MARSSGNSTDARSLIFGILRFFFLGIVFGPLAISNTNKAEAMHHSATFGKVLGGIGTISGIFWTLIFLLTWDRAFCSDTDSGQEHRPLSG